MVLNYKTDDEQNVLITSDQHSSLMKLDIALIKLPFDEMV